MNGNIQFLQIRQISEVGMQKFNNCHEKGFVFLELLIAMTILSGSITALHTIYGNLVSKQIKLQKAQAALIERVNQSEFRIAREHLKLVAPQWHFYHALAH